MRVCEEIKSQFVAQDIFFYLRIHLFNTRHANLWANTSLSAVSVVKLTTILSILMPLLLSTQ